MTLLGELLKDPSPVETCAPAQSEASAQTHTDKRRSGPSSGKAASLQRVVKFSIRDEQIHSLVQQLFFRRDAAPVRHVGFAPVDSVGQTARLCLDVAKALSGDGRYEVGLIDAGVGEAPLPTQLRLLSRMSAPWAIAPRLWLAPRESWCPPESKHPASDRNLERLREITGEFDFSILRCPPVSWLAARVSECCDGLVLVITANRTRRLVAAQIKDQLSKNSVPVLGTVLTDRRFPVPEGLYRSL